jgi:hypothetical protein
VKKIVLVGVLSLAVAMVSPSLAGADDVNGPPCADIMGQGSSGSYLADGTVTVGMALGAPACASVDYSVTVITASGSQQLPLAGANTNGDVLFFQGTINPDANAFVCVYGTTSVGGGRHVFDYAPNPTAANCTIAGAPDSLSIAKTGSPSFGGFS